VNTRSQPTFVVGDIAVYARSSRCRGLAAMTAFATLVPGTRTGSSGLSEMRILYWKVLRTLRAAGYTFRSL
jgi:hypothetical protein